MGAKDTFIFTPSAVSPCGGERPLVPEVPTIFPLITSARFQSQKHGRTGEIVKDMSREMLLIRQLLSESVSRYRLSIQERLVANGMNAKML